MSERAVMNGTVGHGEGRAASAADHLQLALHAGGAVATDLAAHKPVEVHVLYLDGLPGAGNDL